MNIKYKHDILWLIMTLLLIVIVSITQMYSRAETLNAVQRTNFHLFYKLLNENAGYSESNLSNTFSPLLTKKKYARFHVALIKENSCDEITKHYYNQPYLCDIFKNSNQLKILLGKSIVDKKIIEKRSNEFTSNKFEKYQSYMFQKLNDSNSWLIAKTNFYYKDTKWEQFKYFLFNRYVQANGFSKIFYKGQYLAYTILLFSFTLWLMLKLYLNRQNKKYLESIKEEEKLHSRWKELDSKLNIIKNEHYEKELEIESLKEKVKQVSDGSDNQKNKLLKTIEELEANKKKLLQALNANKASIEKIELEEIKLNKTISKQILKLEDSKKEDANIKIQERTAQLEQLWRYEPSWTDRKVIESLVALKDTHLPFTITQGFIAFDQLVLRLVKNNLENFDEDNSNLFKNINLIFEHGLLPGKFKNDLHEIRAARNKWFHAGIYPKIVVIENLVSILQNVDAKPLI